MSSCGNVAKLGFHVLSPHFSLMRRGDAPKEKSLFTYSRILSEIYHCFVASSPQATFLFFHTHHLSSRDPVRSFLLLQEVSAWPWSFYKWMFHMGVWTWWFCSSFVDLYREIIILTVGKCLKQSWSLGFKRREYKRKEPKKLILEKWLLIHPWSFHSKMPWVVNK